SGWRGARRATSTSRRRSKISGGGSAIHARNELAARVSMTRLPPSLENLLDRPEAERKIGPFALIEPLGRGGFAPVWLAREVYGATEVRTAAVKLFSLESAA